MSRAGTAERGPDRPSDVEPRIRQAVELMTRFAERTGVAAGPTRRYLWTDAFALCNLLELGRRTGEPRFEALAGRLVDRVHHTLGRHRADDARTGWLSGLGDAAGEAHPTLGGLRIGKPLPERAPGEPFDERLEWERDGQYFHYLTRWMHALDQLAQVTGDATFNVWARELAEAAYRRFRHGPPGRARLYWKMSVDLSRPLVPSMGHHDALDGFVTCVELEATAARMGAATRGPDLGEAIAELRAMIDRPALATADPLGIGGLLVDGYRVAQLAARPALAHDEGLAASLLAAALVGLRHYVAQPDLRRPAADRLAFRELGLAIGLAAVPLLDGQAAARLAPYAPVAEQIVSFWVRPEHRRGASWLDHADINDVMLATALAPEGFLVLGRDAGT